MNEITLDRIIIWVSVVVVVGIVVLISAGCTGAPEQPPAPTAQPAGDGNTFVSEYCERVATVAWTGVFRCIDEKAGVACWIYNKDISCVPIPYRGDGQ